MESALPMGEHGVVLLFNRKIDEEMAVRYGVHTAKWDKPNKIGIPDDEGKLIAFPYRENGVLVNTKWRGERSNGEKVFIQQTGGKKTFWNSDVLDDPGLASGHHKLIITEGEFDALAAITARWPHVVSVPDGAPPANSAPFSLEDDKNNGKFGYVWNNADRLKKVKHFILAVDDDPPGKRLAEELVRRFGAVRCSFVTYPKGCKDLNEVLIKHGTEAVTDVINGAQPYPVDGIYHFSSYPPKPEFEVFTTGWPLLDQHFRIFMGEFVVITGIPSHGKTQWLLNLAVNVSRLHGWKIAIFSPEMPTVPHLHNVLRRIVSGDNRQRKATDEFLEQQFVILDIDPEKRDATHLNVSWVIEKATDAVLSEGIRMLIIDPWNEVEHAREKGENQTDYIGRAIRELKAFGQRFGVTVFVVAHPTKDVYERGKPRRVTLYDIEGSAHWFNKCDHGIVVERLADIDQRTKIWVAKSRFEATGVRGEVTMKYHNGSGRFTALDEDEGGAMTLL